MLAALCKCFVEVALRKCCRSFREVLCILVFYLKNSIIQPELQDCTPRATFALKSCDFCLEKLPQTRRGSNPRPCDSESSRANHATTSKDQFASNKLARRHSESASTRTTPAEGSSGTLQIRTSASTTLICAEGRSGMLKIEKSPQIL